MTAIFSQRWRVAAVLAFWLSLAGIIPAADDVEKKNERLGFKFDPQAHEAAVENDNHGNGANAVGSLLPADDILHLSKVVVTGKRVPFNSRDVLTPKGRLEFAKETYLTPAYEKTFGPLGQLASYYFNFLAIFGGWHPNDADAMALYQDAEQKRRNIEMSDLLDIQAFGKSAPENPSLEKTPVRKSGWGLIVPHLSTP